ncbi:MAG: SpoIIE family protein phosphatase [Alistipes sp.]
MRKLLFKRSFAGRVSAYIIVLIMVIFCVVMISFYKVAREKIIDSSVRHSASMLTNMSQQIDAQLQSVAHSIDNTVWIAEANINNLDSIKKLLTHNIDNNPLIMGGSVAYEPDTVNGQERLKMIYVFKNDSGVIIDKMSNENYYYPTMDWYLSPKKLKQSYWSEPYFDEGSGNVIMVTYSHPLINSAGEVYAIYTADISLLHFSDLMEKIQPFPNSYSFMLSRQGYYITHRKKERILHETIFTRAVADSNSDYEQIGRSMTSGESGSRMFKNDRDRSYAIYTPVSNIGWSICNVGKQDVLLADLNTATRSIIIIFIAGIICFFLFTLLIIKRLMKPLEGFALSAKEIAHGNFEAHLPEIKSEDEMKTLHDSFVYMQQSLATYMAELKLSTASKERIESELNIAHKIQMGMLPRIFPPFPEREDVELYATLKPAKEVGGDLYDFFILDEKLYFTIGDVSGKGVPASLFMAVIRTLFRNISRSTLSSEEIIGQMNESMTQQNDTNMFVTLFVGILDLQNGKLDYCNAGHNPPVLVTSDGTTTLLKPKKNQLAVGIFSETVYTSESTTLESGTKLFCYTDGIVEAENIGKELYREDRLMETLSAHHQCDAKRLTEQVLKSVAEHVLDAEQSDDLTVLVIKYKK